MADPTLNTTTETIVTAPQVLPYVWTILLSCWGGAVSHFQNNRKQAKPFNWRELLFDLVTSSFAGLLTYLFCQAAHIEGPMGAMLVAISGHMGTRAIASLQNVYERIIGSKSDDVG